MKVSLVVRQAQSGAGNQAVFGGLPTRRARSRLLQQADAQSPDGDLVTPSPRGSGKSAHPVR